MIYLHSLKNQFLIPGRHNQYPDTPFPEKRRNLSALAYDNCHYPSLRQTDIL